MTLGLISDADIGTFCLKGSHTNGTLDSGCHIQLQQHMTARGICSSHPWLNMGNLSCKLQGWWAFDSHACPQE